MTQKVYLLCQIGVFYTNRCRIPITISKEEVVIVYNFFLFWRIDISELYIIVTIDRNILYGTRKRKKFT